jgi:hypothetical protein
MTSNKETPQINPRNYLGRDLRDLPPDEIARIMASYPTLRETDLGYSLGQRVSSLATLRANLDRYPVLRKQLDDRQKWIFNPEPEIL